MCFLIQNYQFEKWCSYTFRNTMYSPLRLISKAAGSACVEEGDDFSWYIISRSGGNMKRKAPLTLHSYVEIAINVLWIEWNHRLFSLLGNWPVSCISMGEKGEFFRTASSCCSSDTTQTIGDEEKGKVVSSMHSPERWWGINTPCIHIIIVSKWRYAPLFLTNQNKHTNFFTSSAYQWTSQRSRALYKQYFAKVADISRISF